MLGNSRLALVGVVLLSSISLTQASAQEACGPSGCAECGESECGESECGCSEGCVNGCCEDKGSGCCLFGDSELGDPWKLDSSDNDINIGGWWQGGYTSESTGMFNNLPDRFNTHQMWLYAEKVADGSEGLDWGFRADVMYGIDAGDTQAFGNTPGEWDFVNGWDRGAGYGWAMPQLYAEVAKGDWSIKAGHFFTLVGYEVVPSPDNFFYSHAYTMYNSEPFTHTGALATYNASDDVTVYGGWTSGWDTGFDQFGDGSNFLGGFSVSLTEDATYTYILTAGNMGARGDGYSHSNVVDLTLTDKLNYVIQSDLVSLRVPGGGHNDEVGLNQYLIYTVSDRIGVGARLEWWKSDAGFNHGGLSATPGRVSGPVDGGSTSYYAATLGVNIRPCANLVIRPEWRYDWFPHANYEQGMFGVDAIATF